MSSYQKLCSTFLFTALSTSLFWTDLSFGEQKLRKPLVETRRPLLAGQKITHPAMTRFTVLLDPFDNLLRGASVEEAIDRFNSNDNRTITFRLEGLARIYEKEDQTFKTMREKFKGLEDRIGKYQKWDALLSGARPGVVSETVLSKFSQNRSEARKDLGDYLLSSQILGNFGELPYTQELRVFLSNYKWKKVKKDRKLVVERLIDDLKDLKKTTYDFTYLEQGDGVHELRRDLRWFNIEARVLNGLVVLKPFETPCPVPSYAAVVNESIATTKHAVLPPSASEPDPIRLTPCLYVQMAKLISVVDDIKEAAETESNTIEGEANDLVKADVKQKIELIWQDVLSSNLLGLLQDELKAGIKDDKEAKETRADGIEYEVLPLF